MILVGTHDDNRVFNSIACDIELPDGTIREHAANAIAENTLAQVDKDGFYLSLMKGIVDYKRNDVMEISKADNHVVTVCW